MTVRLSPQPAPASRGLNRSVNLATTRTDRRMPDAACIDCLSHSHSSKLRRPGLPRRVAFWLLAFVFTATMLGTTLPTPLYVIYQAQWRFSAAVVTVIFAVYATGVLAALLLAGRLSDQAGRKPVLAAALGFSALSTVVFIVAPNVEVLLAARILSGLSAGLMKHLPELVDDHVGLGPLVAGLFAQYAPKPTVAVFEVYLVVLAAAALCLFFVPETVSPRRRPTLRFAGLGIPDGSRGEFIAAGMAGFSAFSLLGLFSALAPTFLGSVIHQHSHAIAGAVVFLLFAAGTFTQLLASRFGSRKVVTAGLSLLLAALALIVAALSQATMALFLAAIVVAGVAVGAVFLGSLATANRLAPPEYRGQVISTYFVLCYCGLIIPVVGVGVASEFIGDFPAVLAFSSLLAALCLFSLVSIRRAIAPGPPRWSSSARRRHASPDDLVSQ